MLAPRATVAGLACLALLLPSGVAPAPTARVDGWYEGFEGFRQAVEEVRARGGPMVVYFYTDWCGYCRQLERELLYTEAVEKYTSGLIRVRINPETGAAERTVADKYQVAGYPSLFVHPPRLGPAHRISQMQSDAAGVRLKTIGEFIESLRRAAGN